MDFGTKWRYIAIACAVITTVLGVYTFGYRQDSKRSFKLVFAALTIVTLFALMQWASWYK